MLYSMAIGVLFAMSSGNCHGILYKINETEYARMPALYALDPYERCVRDPSGLYCVVDAALYADATNPLMDMILDYSAHTRKHFNHTQIHRGVCITKTCSKFAEGMNLNNTVNLKIVLGSCLNESLWNDYNLQVRIEKIINCDRYKEGITVDGADVVMAMVYMTIIAVNMAGSLYGLIWCKDSKNCFVGNRYLLCFSIHHNWKKMTSSSSGGPDPRLTRLKAFHGLRTITMICVFFSHGALIMNYAYIENPLYIEATYNDLSKQILLNGSLVVYTFFVMSAFLLAYNFQLHAEQHNVTWMDIPKGILLRWLRLTPTYLLVLGSVCTWCRHLGSGPLWYMVVGSEARACRTYWWLHPLYINNYVYEDAFCMPQAWYLAADMQLFCVGLVICVFARSGRARKITLCTLFGFALVIPAAHTYFQDLDAAIIQTPETLRSVYSRDDTFRLLYIRGHTNLATYVLGLAGGFLTYHWQQQGVDLSKYKKFRPLYWAMFPLAVGIILTGGIFYIDGYRVPTALRVGYAVLYKPAFQTLVVICIIGFVFKYECVYRRIVEWRGWAWCGRVSYSAFLLHVLFQRGFFGAIQAPIHMFDYFMLILLSATILMTYVSAALLWLLVEEPLNQFFKIFLKNTPKKDLLGPKIVELSINVVQTKLTLRSVYSRDDTFRLLYIRGHTNLATYVLGLAGGFLTYHWQQQGVDLSKYKKFRPLYWAMFPLAVGIILTGGIFYIDGYRVPTALRVGYAVLYKPAFQTLVVICIIGFVFKYECVYRRIVEWRGWAWCGRVSYSAFLLHVLFQRGFFGAIQAPIHMFDYFMLILLSATILMTYVSAALLWLLVEEPLNQFFKIFLKNTPKKDLLGPKIVELSINVVQTKL